MGSYDPRGDPLKLSPDPTLTDVLQGCLFESESRPDIDRTEHCLHLLRLANRNIVVCRRFGVWFLMMLGS